MNTTQLIELLQRLEHGASGRPREISLMIKYKNGKRKFLYTPSIKFDSSGDGTLGAELGLLIEDDN